MRDAEPRCLPEGHPAPAALPQVVIDPHREDREPGHHPDGSHDQAPPGALRALEDATGGADDASSTEPKDKGVERAEPQDPDEREHNPAGQHVAELVLI